MAFTDVWGPSRVTGINGERYYISFTDGAKRRTMTFFMKKRSEVLDKIKEYEAYISTQTGKPVKAFHCDNAKEYISKEVRDYLGSKGIRLELTAPYSPQQNGVAERLNRTLIEHARAMLAAHSLPLILWPEAIAYATFSKTVRLPVPLARKSRQMKLFGERSQTWLCSKSLVRHVKFCSSTGTMQKSVLKPNHSFLPASLTSPVPGDTTIPPHARFRLRAMSFSLIPTPILQKLLCLRPSSRGR
jgi:hypothetical protein